GVSHVENNADAITEILLSRTRNAWAFRSFAGEELAQTQGNRNEASASKWSFAYAHDYKNAGDKASSSLGGRASRWRAVRPSDILDGGREEVEEAVGNAEDTGKKKEEVVVEGVAEEAGAKQDDPRPSTTPSPGSEKDDFTFFYLRDNGDIQWRELRGNLPILFLTAILTAVAHRSYIAFRSSARSQTTLEGYYRRQSLLVMGCGFVLYLHGLRGLVYITLLFGLLQFVFRRIDGCGTRNAKTVRLLTWTAAVGLFLLRDSQTVLSSIVTTSSPANPRPELLSLSLLSTAARAIFLQLVYIQTRFDSLVETIIRSTILSPFPRALQGPLLRGSLSMESGVRFLIIKVLAFGLDWADSVQTRNSQNKETDRGSGRSRDDGPREEEGDSIFDTDARPTNDVQQLRSFVNVFTYVCFPPLFLAGPLIGYREFLISAGIATSTSRRDHATSSPPVTGAVDYKRNDRQTAKALGRYFLRFLLHFVLLEFFLHWLPVYALVRSGTIFHLLESEQSSAGLAVKLVYWMLPVLWLKFATLWRFFRFWSLLMGVDVVENMQRCFSNTNTLQGFWRGWHCSFNRFILKYLYIPLGGRKTKHWNVFVIFFFVAIWHDMQPQYLVWGALNAMFMVCEILVQTRWYCWMSKAWIREEDRQNGKNKNDMVTTFSRFSSSSYSYTKYIFSTSGPLVSYHLPVYVASFWCFVICMVNSIGYGLGLAQGGASVQHAVTDFSDRGVWQALFLMYVFFVAISYSTRRWEEATGEWTKGHYNKMTQQDDTGQERKDELPGPGENKNDLRIMSSSIYDASSNSNAAVGVMNKTSSATSRISRYKRAEYNPAPPEAFFRDNANERV
ncbi:unnamed protein product, partial [Amoebophrya sp. A25]